jgi:hypothetical protein
MRLKGIVRQMTELIAIYGVAAILPFWTPSNLTLYGMVSWDDFQHLPQY